MTFEAHDDSLVVAASEAQLLELERRRLVRVDRLATQAEFEARARGSAHSGGEGGPARPSFARVTSQDPQLMLAPLLTAPLGLDVWEVKPDHVVLQASEAQIERLEQMGYGVEQLHMTQTYLSTFATAEATVAITQRSNWSRIFGLWPSGILISPNFARSGAASRNRPIWALRLGDRHGTDHKVLLLGCHHAKESGSL